MIISKEKYGHIWTTLHYFSALSFYRISSQFFTSIPLLALLFFAAPLLSHWVVIPYPSTL
jgi:hypothetical protein